MKWLRRSRPVKRSAHAPRKTRLFVELLESRTLLSGGPSLTVALASHTIAENAGPAATTGTVTRNNVDLSQPLTVNLSSSNTNQAAVPASVTIPANAASTTFNVDAVDDHIHNGTQTVTITATAASPLPVGLDATFGNGGFANVPLSVSSSANLPDMLVQPDGKVVAVAGSQTNMTTWSVTRTLSSGTPDPNFGTNGMVDTTFPGSNGGYANGVAVQPDGKLVVVGTVLAAGARDSWGIARYNPDGTLDTTFGTGGLVQIRFSGEAGWAYDVAVLPDSELLVGGMRQDPSGFAVARLTSTGQVDTTFGSGGVASVNPDPTHNWYNTSGQAMTAQPDGKILMTGIANFNSLPVVRFNANGTLDTTFNGTGIQLIPEAAFGSSANSVEGDSLAVQADGKIVVVGSANTSSSNYSNWVTARLNSDGSLDTSFNGGGVSVLNLIGNAPSAHDVVVQPDGKILVGGQHVIVGTGFYPALARYNPDGTLDNSFNGTGELLVSPTGPFQTVWAIAMQADGTLAAFEGYYTTEQIAHFNTGLMAGSDVLSVTDTDGAPTSTAVTAAPTSSVYGQSVTLTAVVTANAPGSGTPTGTVTFTVGATTLGTATLDGTGTATLTTAALPTGTDTVTATYNGDTNFSSSPGTTTETVSQDGTTTAVSAAPTTSVYGQSVSLTATVSANAPGSGTPTGTVTFTVGSTTLGTATLDGTGTATLNTTALPTGTDTVTATYNGDSNFTSSPGTRTETVTQDGTSTALAAAPTSSYFGQAVTLTATVSANSPGSGTPTGTVTFTNGATTLGTATLSNGTATLTTSALPVGTDTVTATYGGDANFTTSAGTTTATVVPNSTTSVTASPTSAVYGQTVKLTATVAPVGSGTPTGTVTFTVGATTLGTATLSGGKATLSTTLLPVGTDTVTATYSGDSNFSSSSGTTTVGVSQDGTTTTLTSSANPSVYSQKVTFTARVTANAPGSGTPTGTVTFMDGSTTLGTVALSNNTATFATSTLALGSHSITAAYSGDSNFTGSSAGPLNQTVNVDGSVTTVTSSANPSVYSQAVTFTAKVVAKSPGTGTPTGAVTFMDGSTTLGTVALSAGKATLTTSNLNLGSNSIAVSYSGDTNFTASSATLTQTVNQDATVTTLSSSADPSVYGQTVTITAKVAAKAPGTGTPTGTVTFMDGSTTLGTGTLSGGKATYTTAAFSYGNHSLTAVYSGDTNFTGSTSVAFRQTVNQDGTTTTVTSSVNPSALHQAVTFTAVVSAKSPGSGTPTGTVTFKDGTTVLGTSTLDSNGQTTFTASNLKRGNHSITAAYNGDTNFLKSTSAAVIQTVNGMAPNVLTASQVLPDRHSAARLPGTAGQTIATPAASFETTVTGLQSTPIRPSAAAGGQAPPSSEVWRAGEETAQGWGTAGNRTDRATGVQLRLRDDGR
jgi:uncharacterized delta-60 repeat protein